MATPTKSVIPYRPSELGRKSSGPNDTSTSTPTKKSRRLSLKELQAKVAKWDDDDDKPAKKRRTVDFVPQGKRRSRSGKKSLGEDAIAIDMLLESKASAAELVAKELKHAADKAAKEEAWHNSLLYKFGRGYSDIEWSHALSRKLSYEFFTRFSFGMIPLLCLCIIWDLLAINVFDIPHLTWLQINGALMPIHFMCLAMSMLGYMKLRIRTKKSTQILCEARLGVFFHPIILVTYCVFEIRYNESRGEGGTRFEKYFSGSLGRPENYDPNYRADNAYTLADI